VLNGIWLTLVVTSVLLAAGTGRMRALTETMLADAGRAVEIAIGLVGVMALFLGVFKVAEAAGLPRLVGRLVGPLMRRLFPSVPPDHPAMSAMVLNISSNLLGLANAATPFGIRAMEELDRLNGRKGTATNAMVTFLAINTAGFALLPSSVIAIRAAMGSADVTGILLPTWIASACGTGVAIAAAGLFARFPSYRRSEPPLADDEDPQESAPEIRTSDSGNGTAVRRALAWTFWAGLVVAGLWRVLSTWGRLPAFEIAREILSYWTLPAILAGVALFGWSRGVRVYATLVEGAREGFQVAVRILPYLVAIVVMAGMFRASGGMERVVAVLDPLTRAFGMPAEALPMALLRPLSGSGALGVMTETLEAHGPDSAIGYLVSTLQGSTETTFYVLAVYFGAVHIRHTRHALPACLAADATAMLAAVAAVRIFGPSAVAG
jgi:spore maturation protein SpmA